MASDYAHKRVRSKVIVPTEATERQALIAGAMLHQGAWPELALLVGIHNELPFIRGAVGNRFTFFRYLKTMGYKKGLPDLFFPVARHGFFGLWIEVKRVKGSTVSTEQSWWHETLTTMGYDVYVTYGFQPGLDHLLWYVQGPATTVVSRDTGRVGG